MAMSELETRSRDLNSERSLAYKGIVKVSTRSLRFFPNFTSTREHVDRIKVDRLKHIMKQEGCNREIPERAIPGSITSALLVESLQRSSINLNQLKDKVQPAKMYLPEGTFIRCAYGKSRARALEELNEVEPWWTIELYVGM